MRFKYIQKLIDKLRGKVSPVTMFKSIINKYECFQRAKDYHTLALGSSHMEHGYIPAIGEINMGCPSQDLYYSYNLYKLLNNTKLKNVLITFSVFTPGDFLIKSGLNKFCVMYKLLYGIPYQYEEYAVKNKLRNKEKFYSKQIAKYRKTVSIPEDYNGSRLFHNNIAPVSIEKIKERAIAHYKINRKEEKNIEYCSKLLAETKENSQNIYFILPPATDYYKSVLPSSDIIFEELYKLCSAYTHVKIINLYDSNEFNNEDFIDGDHLSEKAYKKFTDIIHSHMCS